MVSKNQQMLRLKGCRLGLSYCQARLVLETHPQNLALGFQTPYLFLIQMAALALMKLK